MLTDEQRIKVYGSAERVAEVDAQIEANVAAMPPLTARQRDALKILFSSRTLPPRPAPPALPDRMPPRPAPVKRRPEARSHADDEAAAPAPTRAAA